MKFKDFFPFTLTEYLKVLGFYVIFFVILYLSSFLLTYFSLSVAGVNPDILAESLFFILGMIFSLIALVFFAYTFLANLAYNVVAEVRFKWINWPKFFFSVFIVVIIFLIPFLFSLRLLREGNVAGSIVFLVVFLVFLHFSNLINLFVSLREKTFKGIKEGFNFGTVKFSKLAIPYLFVVIVMFVFSMLMWVMPFDFGDLILSGIFLSWSVLYVGRTIILKEL